MSLDAMEVKQIKQENDGFDSDSDSEFFDASARQYYVAKILLIDFGKKFYFSSPRYCETVKQFNR